MGCRILEEGGGGRAVLYCSTTDTAFGPVFASAEEAEDFLSWLGVDPRLMKESALEDVVSEFRCDRRGEPKTARTEGDS